MQPGSKVDSQSMDEPEVAQTVGLLIDFDNFAPPAARLTDSSVNHALLECIRRALEFSPHAARVEIRLYGGWMSGGLLSRRGSEVAALIAQVDPFPLVLPGKRILRGSLTLALSLLGDVTVLDDTYRNRGAVPRLRLAGTPVPEGCREDLGACPARILKQFTQSSTKTCPAVGCLITARTAFVAHEQKMVDTLLACDLIEMASGDQYSGISVVTADTDLIPPLLHAARRYATPLQLLAPRTNWSPQYASLLQDRHVSVREMEPVHEP